MGRNISVIGNVAQQAFGTFKNPLEVWTESRENVHFTKVTNNATKTLASPEGLFIDGYTNATNTGIQAMFKVIQISKKTGSQADVMAYHSFAKAMAHLEYIQGKPFLTKHTNYAIVLA